MPTRLTQTGAEVQDDLYKIEDIDLATEEKAGLMSPEDKTKLDNIDAEIPTKLSDLEEDPTHKTVTDTEKQTWNNKSDFSGRYQDLTGRPFIPTKTGDLVNNSGFITRLVDDLANYYLKSEVYTKSEVSALIAAMQGISVKVVDVLPTASAETMRAIYLVPSAEPQTGNTKDEWITVEDNGAYCWEQIGSTAISLDGYVTDEELTAALRGYVTSAAFATALAGKQDVIGDLSDIRAGAQAGARAYQKPSTGIPATDLSEGVQASLEKADNPPTEVFWAKYGTTTISELETAISAGKLIVAIKDGYDYYLSKIETNRYGFTRPAYLNYSYSLFINRTTSAWSTSQTTFETTLDKSQDIASDNGSTYKYPSTKAVADYVASKAEVFVATPNVTTFSEIQAAVSTGKAIIAIQNNGTVYTLSSITSSFCYFSNINSTTAQYYIVQSSGWSSGQGALELAEKRVSSWRSTPDNYHYPSEKLVKDSLDAKQPTIDSSHKLDYGLLSNTPTIPDAVEPNPTVPAGTTPTSLTGLKIGSVYYDIDAGGGTVTDVTVGGTSVVSDGVAVIPAIPTVEALTSNEIDTLWANN